MRSFAPLLVFVLLVAAAAFAGSRFTPGEWYASLQRPLLTPPSWLFGPVWTMLYVCIAAAAFLVWRAGDAEGRRAVAIGFWTAQLALNAAWSFLFFGLERPGLALIGICILLGLIVITMVTFHRIRPVAGGLLIPYALWVGFATYLNAGFWWLNR